MNNYLKMGTLHFQNYFGHMIDCSGFFSPSIFKMKMLAKYLSTLAVLSFHHNQVQSFVSYILTIAGG